MINLHVGWGLKGYIYSLFSLSVMFFPICLYLQLDTTVSWWSLLPFLILVFFAESYKVKIFMYHTKESVSLSWSLVLSIAALISLGLWEALLINTLSALIASIYPKRLPIIKVLYNVSAYQLTVFCSGLMFYMLQKHLPVTTNQAVALLVETMTALTYITVNYSLGCILMKLVTRKSLPTIISEIVGPHFPHSVMLAFLGTLLGITYEDYRFVSLIFILSLIFIIIYSMKSTAEAATKRIEELQASMEKSEQLAKELNTTFQEFIQTLTATIDARDPYMYGHSMQVSNYALALASELKLPEQQIERIRIAGLLHDIGKVSIPESILFKKGRLTNEEYEMIKTHASIGEEIVGQISSLQDVAKLVGMHHERYDGKGYPYGVGGEQVPIGAYILAASDVLDCMLSHRSYQRGRTLQEVMDEFVCCRGSHFHPDVVDALLGLRSTLGDDVFQNSALLIDQAIIKGKVKTRRNISLPY